MDVTSVNSASDNLIRAAERQRISRELHESTSQLLVALQLQFGQLRYSIAPGTAEQLFDEISETLQNLHVTIKQIGMQRDDDEALADRQVRTARAFYSLSGTNRNSC